MKKLMTGNYVIITNYKGVLNPRTIWAVMEIRGTICLLKPLSKLKSSSGLLDFTNEVWVETERLEKVRR
jgi:hypothetical protein